MLEDRVLPPQSSPAFSLTQQPRDLQWFVFRQEKAMAQTPYTNA